MISEWFLALVAGFTDWVLALLPDMDWMDGMVVTAQNSLASVMTAAGAISNWFPFQVLSSTLVVVIGSYIALFLVKLIRVLAAHIPLVGGKG